jgi:hypothetical protein
MEFKILKYFKNQNLPKVNDKDLSLYLQNELNNST